MNALLTEAAPAVLPRRISRRLERLHELEREIDQVVRCPATIPAPPPADVLQACKYVRQLEHAGVIAEPECDDCEDTGRVECDEGMTFCWCSAGDVAEDDFSERNGYPRLRGTKRGAQS